MQDWGKSQRVRNVQCKIRVLACRRVSNGVAHPGCSLDAGLGLPLQEASPVIDFQEEKLLHCLCSSCSGLGEVSLKSADFGLNLCIFVFLGKSC